MFTIKNVGGNNLFSVAKLLASFQCKLEDYTLDVAITRNMAHKSITQTYRTEKLIQLKVIHKLNTNYQVKVVGEAKGRQRMQKGAC